MMGFRAEFETALQRLTENRLTVDQVFALVQGRKYEAASLVEQALVTLGLGKLFNARAICGLLELSWRLNGPSKCVHVSFAGLEPRDWIAQFLMQKLAESQTEFDDETLRLTAHYWSKYPAIVEFVYRIQAARLASKASRLQAVPQELAADVAHVKERVSAYKFPPELISLLDKAEDGLNADGDPFDQSAILKHLRTFFEQLHRLIAERIHQFDSALKDGTDLTKCQQVIDYLQRKEVIKDKLQALGRALYGILSEEGVHAIQSKREYVRLCRNMVAEYALILFFEVDRLVGTP